MANDNSARILKANERSLLPFLEKTIAYCVKVLGVVLVLVIVASIIDTIYVFYDKILTSQPIGIIGYEGILAVLGAALLALICIEIFANIALYLKEEKSHVKLVVATAVIAVSRKVIILDYSAIEASYIYATGALVIATALAYWLVNYKTA